ncbi:hypothetical protein MNBD_NITROSPINAE02-1740 [hydrothermal vent metagenome]|uniref:Uncharacterized protein n=1 Tax=hydrothermal vent metagenome TaxID=652676 RepID=A0A3B1C6W0_9ZZZZ
MISLPSAVEAPLRMWVGALGFVAERSCIIKARLVKIKTSSPFGMEDQ